MSFFLIFYCAGEAEKVYWEKINADRMARYNAKREKKRGSDKVKSGNAYHFGLTIFWFVRNRKIQDIFTGEKTMTFRLHLY